MGRSGVVISGSVHDQLGAQVSVRGISRGAKWGSKIQETKRKQVVTNNIQILLINERQKIPDGPSSFYI